MQPTTIGMVEPIEFEKDKAGDQKKQPQHEELKEEAKTSWRSENSTFRKVLRTIALVLVWTCMGAFMEINGPTLKDLILLLGSDYEAVTGSVSGRSVGKFVGAVIGGFLTDRFCRFCDLIIASCLLIAGICIACVPLASNTDLIWFLYLILGTCLGCIDIAGQRIVLLLWLDKAASPMHIVHLGYGVGGFIAPLIANPFLAEVRTYSQNFTNNVTVNVSRGMMSTTIFPTSTETEVISGSRIQYAYLIVAIVTVVMACVFLIYQCKAPLFGKNNKSQKDGRHVAKRRWKDMLNPASCAEGNFCFGATILGVVFLKYFVYTACDRSVGTFLRSYSIDQLKFSKDDGSYLNTIYWIFYTVGRFVTFVAARWVSVKVILLVESVFSVGVGIGLCTVGTHSPLALWILTGMAGFGIGPMFPTGIAWSDLHIEMTGLAMSWVLLGSSSGGLVLFRTAGRAYEYYGPTAFVFIFLALISATLCMDIISTVISLTIKRNKQYDLNQDDIGSEDVATKNYVDMKEGTNGTISIKRHEIKF